MTSAIKRRQPGEVSIARALSKLGVASRSEARALIAAGRVRVGGRVVRDPGWSVNPERHRVSLDGAIAHRSRPLTVLMNKPKGVVVTRSDPQGRRTVHTLLDGLGARVVAVGRLDLASSGLLLLTNDTRLAAWLTDPVNAVARRYVVSVRGEVTAAEAALLVAGVEDRGERLAAASVTVRKRSARESHLLLELHTGRNREVRRLLASLGHEVTALKRIAYGGLTLGDLSPGSWRIVSSEELRRAFPRAGRQRT